MIAQSQVCMRWNIDSLPDGCVLCLFLLFAMLPVVSNNHCPVLYLPTYHTYIPIAKQVLVTSKASVKLELSAQQTACTFFTQGQVRSPPCLSTQQASLPSGSSPAGWNNGGGVQTLHRDLDFAFAICLWEECHPYLGMACTYMYSTDRTWCTYPKVLCDMIRYNCGVIEV